MSAKSKTVKSPKRKIVFGFIALFLIFALCSCSLTTPTDLDPESAIDFKAGAKGELNVYFFDVGQGDSEFIEFPDGRTMLIDGGEVERGETVVNYIKSLSYNKIDFVVATHPHSDHIGGLDDVVEQFEIGCVYLPGVSSSSETYSIFLNALKRKGCPVKEAKSGVAVIKEKNLKAYFLSPDGGAYDDLNEYSAVLKITYKKTSFLFTGDAGAQNEGRIKQSVKADVVKVGHHGSRTASSPGFVKRVKPKYAVISCGAGNEYGHPHTEVVKRWQNIGATVLRTDERGTIVISSDGSSVKAA